MSHSHHQTISLFSPAKINLFLHILGKRPDGYHELHSLFQTVTLGDTLTFSAANRDQLTCTDPEIPTDSSNLVSKAISLFRQKTGVQSYYNVHIEKKIPSQAGLGGGSSNAATTLWALNQMSGCLASISELQEWSAAIGSDIPFFFSQGTAECFGRGEIVKNVPKTNFKDSFWIIKPSINLSTKEVYKRYSPHLIVKLKPGQGNDLEASAFELAPELSQLKTVLIECGFDKVLMTGSGSALFCIGKECKMPQIPNVEQFCVQFLNRSQFAWYK